MRALALVLMVPTAALAQAVQPRQLETPSLWQRCGPVYRGAAMPDSPPLVRLDGPIVSGGSSGTGAASPSSSGRVGDGSPDGQLVMAVVAVAVMPLIVYAMDDDADPLTAERFSCPEFSFSALANVEGPTNGSAPVVGLGSARARLGFSYFGVMSQIDVAPTRGPYTAFSAHLLLRAPPRKHIEGALALGGRRAVVGGRVLDGIEVALPHQYVFWREGRKALGLELMPRAFVYSRGVDFGVDAALVVPLGDYLKLKLGGTVWSFGGQTQLGATAGLTATL